MLIFGSGGRQTAQLELAAQCANDAQNILKSQGRLASYLRTRSSPVVSGIVGLRSQTLRPCIPNGHVEVFAVQGNTA